MQVQLFNDTMASTGPVFEIWPNTSIDLASLDWMAVTTLVPFLQALYGNTTNGLANNTLYDVPISDFINATVQATTVNAHCGLLTNLSIEVLGGSTWNVSSSMPALGLVSTMVSYPPCKLLPDVRDRDRG